MTARGRNPTVDALRGIAALAVCWFHFTNGNDQFLTDGWLKSSGARGWLGVEVFFVISGFIIPQVMWSTGYQVRRDVGRFVARRLIRLTPPYWVAVGVTAVLWFGSALLPGYRGGPVEVSGPGLVLHLTYLSGLVGAPWWNPVFWTLAIELQFYLFMAVSFGLLTHPKRLVPTATLGVAATLFFLLPQDALVWHYIGYFGLGLAAFYHRNRFWGLAPRVFVLLGALTLCVLGGDVVAALVGMTAALLIGWGPAWGGRRLLWLGGLSYSLYLVHVPIGGRVINLATRLPDHPVVVFGALVLALLASIVAAMLLQRFVEVPALGWSARLRRRQAGRADTVSSPRLPVVPAR